MGPDFVSSTEQFRRKKLLRLNEAKSVRREIRASRISSRSSSRGSSPSRSVPWPPVVMGAAAIGLGIAIPVLVWILARPLALLLLAIVLAEALAPAVSRLGRRIPRTLAIIVVNFGLALVGGGIVWVLIPRLVDQGQVLISEGPQLIDRGRDLVRRWDPGGDDRLLTAAQQRFDRVGGWVVDVPMTLVSAVVEIVLVVFMSVYWLISSPALSRFVRSLVPQSRRAELSGVFSQMGRAMGGYVRGVTIDATIMGLLAYVGLLVIGFDYPIVGGLITMIGELVPVIGPIAAAVPIVAFAWAESPQIAVSALVLYVVLQQIEGQLLTSNIMRSQTDVSQVVALFALFAGSALGGILGALIANPLAAAGRVLVIRVIAPAVRRRTDASVGSLEQSASE